MVASSPSPEIALNVTERPPELLMPWQTDAAGLDLIRGIRRALPLAEGCTTDPYLAALAAETVVMAPQIQTLRQRVTGLETGAHQRPRSSGPGKKSGGRKGGGRVTLRSDKPKHGPLAYDRAILDDEKLSRLQRLYVGALEFSVAVANAVAGNPEPLLELESWGDDALPNEQDRTADQVLAIQQIDQYMQADGPAYDPERLAGLNPLEAYGFLNGVLASAMNGWSVIYEEYLAASYIGLVSIQPDAGVLMRALNPSPATGLSSFSVNDFRIQSGYFATWATLSEQIADPPDLLQVSPARLEFVRGIEVHLPLRLATRVKRHPLSDQLRVLAGQHDQIIASRAQYLSDFEELLEGPEEAVRALAQPWIEAAQATVQKEQENADRWLAPPEGEAAREAAATGTARLTRLRLDDVNEAAAGRMAALFVRLAGAAHEAEAGANSQSDIVGAVRTEQDLQATNREEVEALTELDFMSPERCTSAPLASVLDLVLRNWRDVRTYVPLPFAVSNKDAHRLIGRVAEWLAAAQALVPETPEAEPRP